jgi:rhamnulokinase
MSKYIGIDLGASSGRLIVGVIKDKKLNLKEIHRFSNGGIKIFDSLYWNLLDLYEEIIKGLKKYVERYRDKPSGIGIDTWGVDFVLLDEDNELIGTPHHYRDKRTEDMIEKMFEIVPKDQIYDKTGIQFSRINSLTQLYSMVYCNSPKLSIAENLLMIPDYFNFLLTGKKFTEYTIATTTQLYNPRKKTWDNTLIRQFSLNPSWFMDIIQTGTIFGDILPAIGNQTGLNTHTKIIASGAHDTASAIAAVPVLHEIYNSKEWAYISSGTWSLLGIETRTPIINKKALKYNFTNEGGVNDTIRFLKNLTGMWLIQECKRVWNETYENLTWEDIDSKAKKAESFQYYINPDDSKFINPNNMVNAIQNYCEDHKQNIPETVGEISRTIFESLAFRYKQIISYIQNITKVSIKVIHIVGGGSNNEFLNQMTSNSLNLPVHAGPMEATAIGNILIQAMATNEIASLKELRNIVRNSFYIKEYHPKHSKLWKKKFKDYLTNTNQSISTE